MKKILMVVMAMIMAFGTSYAADQKEKSPQEVRKEIRKERQQIRKMSNKELKQKVDKSVKKEAKRLRKEGWDVKPGNLPLEKQLEKAYLMQYEYDADLFPKYIMGSASSVGEHYDAAKVSATSLAVNDLAGQIQVEVTALIENTVANKQLSADEAASISETVMTSKSLISQSIGRTIPVMEIFRINEKKNTEVLVRIAYNSEMARQSAKKALRAALEDRGEKLHEQLDLILGL